MLTTWKKAELLVRAGIDVPPFSEAPAPGGERQIVAVTYVAARAATSLRESAVAEGLRHLQAANLSHRLPPRPRHKPGTRG